MASASPPPQAATQVVGGEAAWAGMMREAMERAQEQARAK